MNCPFCGSSQITVTNSRPNTVGSQIWRRRKCLKCGSVYTTYERIDLSYIVVIKKSGKHQKYDHGKLYSGIYHSTIDAKHFDKGESSGFAEDVTALVETELVKLNIKVINSTQLTELILETLRKKSLDCFLRFLAYRKGGSPKEIGFFLKKYF